ncbi:hypothetical protein GINT2_001328 [Glugoides intestinalis]
MESFVGKNLRVKTAEKLYEGKMNEVNCLNGIIKMELNSKQPLELKFTEILNISLADEEEVGAEMPLKEADMYLLFFEAFNIFGPFEDQFVSTVANSLKKFIRELSTARVKILVGSDDIFGRIGLCFARLLLDKTLELSVEIRCELNDLRTMKYQNAFLNSGGGFNLQKIEETGYTTVLFATNRHGDFSFENELSGQVLLLDIPQAPVFSNFIGLGLGFIPEHYQSCKKFYYLIDVSFGAALAKKFKLPQNFKNSLVKIETQKS